MSKPLMVAAEYNTGIQPQIDALEPLSEMLDTTQRLAVAPSGGGRIELATISLRATVGLSEVGGMIDELLGAADAEVKLSTLEYNFTPPEQDLQAYPPALASFKRFGKILPPREHISVNVDVLFHRDTGDKSIALSTQSQLPTNRMDQIRRIGREMIDLDRADEAVSDSFSSVGFSNDDETTDSISALSVLTDTNGVPFFATQRTGFGSAITMSFDDALDRVDVTQTPGTESIVKGQMTQFGELELMFANRSEIPQRARQNATSHLLSAIDTEPLADRLGGSRPKDLGVAVFSGGAFLTFRPTELVELYYNP